MAPAIVCFGGYALSAAAVLPRFDADRSSDFRFAVWEKSCRHLSVRDILDVSNLDCVLCCCGFAAQATLVDKQFGGL